MTSAWRGLVAQVERLDGDPLDRRSVCVRPAPSVTGPEPAHERLERAPASPPRCPAAGRSGGRVVIGASVHVSRSGAGGGRSGARHDGQSCGTSWPQRSSSCRMPLSASSAGERRVCSSAPVVSSHMPCPQTSSSDTRERSQSRWSPCRFGDVVDRVVEVGRHRRARPSRASAPGRSCRRGTARRGKRSARRRAKFSAWKAPIEQPVVSDLLRAAAVVVDERHHLVDDPRLVRAVPPRPLLQRQVAVDQEAPSYESTQ